jgi:RNA polymerase sigma factor (sigma-70 family)
LQIRRELLTLSARCRGGAEVAMGEESAGGEDLAEATSGPEELALWTEFHRHVEELDDPLREAFDLLYCHGLSQAEAAELLGVSDRTVRDRWRGARLALMWAVQQVVRNGLNVLGVSAPEQM